MKPESHPAFSKFVVPEDALDKIPERTRIAWSLKLFSMGSLAWDYADTVIDCAIIMRLSETKPLSRAVREIHNRYNNYRKRFIDQSYIDKETQIGLNIEEFNETHLTKLHYGLMNEIKEWGRMSDKEQSLFMAVYQCLTIISAMKLYAAKLDTFIGTQGLLALLPVHFRRLYDLIKEYVGDKYQDSPTVSLTAQILCKEVDEMVFWDEEGEYN